MERVGTLHGDISQPCTCSAVLRFRDSQTLQDTLVKQSETGSSAPCEAEVAELKIQGLPELQDKLRVWMCKECFSKTLS